MVIKPEKRRPKFRFSVIVLFFFLSFAACFAIYMKDNQYDPDKENFILSTRPDETTAATEESTSETDVSQISTVSEAIQLTEPVATQLPQQSAVNPIPESQSVGWEYITESNFVGDSITTGLSGYNIVPAELVLASVGMNMDKLLTEPVETPSGSMTVVDALKANQPKHVYIMMGSNGISWMSTETMLGKLGDFVSSVQANLPQSDIYLISVPPVTTARETMADYGVLNSDIDSYNSALLDFANQRGVYYIDLNTALKGNDGKFPEERAARDGMHFKKETYDLMLSYIMTHTYRESMMSDASFETTAPDTSDAEPVTE